MPTTRRIYRRSSNVVESVASGVGRVFESVFDTLFSSFGREADLLMNKVENNAIRLQGRLLKNLAFSITLGLGSLLLIISFYYYMTQNQGMTRASAFFVLAVIVLVASWLLSIWRDYDARKTY